MTKYVVKYKSANGEWLMSPCLYSSWTEAEMGATGLKVETKIEAVEIASSASKEES